MLALAFLIPPMARRCGPLPFAGLLVMTVWGSILVYGGTWLTATLMAILTCLLVMIGMTARLWFLNFWFGTRVFVNDELVNEVEIATSIVQGVAAETGENVGLGVPASLNIRGTVVMVMSFPEVVLGRALVGHDQHLRAAGVA